MILDGAGLEKNEKLRNGGKGLRNRVFRVLYFLNDPNTKILYLLLQGSNEEVKRK